MDYPCQPKGCWELLLHRPEQRRQRRGQNSAGGARWAQGGAKVEGQARGCKAPESTSTFTAGRWACMSLCLPIPPLMGLERSGGRVCARARLQIAALVLAGAQLVRAASQCTEVAG